VEAAMRAVRHYLVDEEAGLIKLLSPPFDQSSALEPGYIKGYVPGVRENGGQYTHAAVWTVMALCPAWVTEIRAGSLFHLINPINHSKTQFGCIATYKGRALCNGCRCLCNPPSYRSWRLDLVYRLCKMDVSSGDEVIFLAFNKNKQSDNQSLYSR
jgi:hypothetical protein